MPPPDLHKLKLPTLSLEEARKIALQAQRVLTYSKNGRAVDATLAVINHLSYVQIDTISVIQRAHHHTLWNRNPRYQAAQLDTLQRQGDVFEYWSHAAAYLPIADYRMCLPNMERVKSGHHLWFKADPKIKQKVLDRISIEGACQSKDFENHGATRLPMWQWKPAKYALEALFMEGEIMVARRDKFHKVYDLRERVLGADVCVSMPSEEEFLDYLIFNYLRANGFGSATEIAYLRKGYVRLVARRIERLVEDGALDYVVIADKTFCLQASALELLSIPLQRSRLRILSPFDNLVIQRNRIKHLFGFDFQLECYVPEKKRKFGYFCLPILMDGRLVARLDCKADRSANKKADKKAAKKAGVLVVKNLYFESGLTSTERFASALAKTILKFLAFNQCSKLDVSNISYPRILSHLEAHDILA